MWYALLLYRKQHLSLVICIIRVILRYVNNKQPPMWKLCIEWCWYCNRIASWFSVIAFISPNEHGYKYILTLFVYLRYLNVFNYIDNSTRFSCSMLAKCQTLLATIIHKRVFSAPISYAAYIVHKIMSITVQNQRTKGEHNNNNWYIIFLYAQKRIINALLVKLL